MTDPLPAAGPERLIFVRALREFSNNCLPPHLEPRCPFFRVGPDGPYCFEECMDLLAVYEPEGPSDTSLVCPGTSLLGRCVEPGADESARPSHSMRESANSLRLVKTSPSGGPPSY
jgi:hypothetical protein